MRTIEKTIYQFEELSESAKENARSWYRNGMEWFWCEESIASIKAFCDAFNVTLRDYSVDSCMFDYSADFSNENFRGVKLRDAMKWRNETPTGYCLDCTLWITFADEFKRHGNAMAAFDAALYAGFRAWRDDLEYQESDDCIDENIAINEYEFDENGRFAA